MNFHERRFHGGCAERREDFMSEILISEKMPVSPLRGLTVFPRQLIHFDVGREKSVKALELAMKGDQRFF